MPSDEHLAVAFTLFEQLDCQAIEVLIDEVSLLVILEHHRDSLSA